MKKLIVLLVLLNLGCVELNTTKTIVQDDFNRPERAKDREDMVGKNRETTLKLCRDLEDKQFTDRYPFGAGEQETATFRDTWYDHQAFDHVKVCTGVGFKP